MHKASAPLLACILAATLMGACRPRYVAPGAEIRSLARSLRVHGVAVRVPADLREEGVPEHLGPPNSRYLSWSDARVWVTADSASERTVVLIIGRTLGDSALVRRMADTVQPMPD